MKTTDVNQHAGGLNGAGYRSTEIDNDSRV